MEDTDHATSRLAQTFLSAGAVIPQCCGPGTVDYQPKEVALGHGLVTLRLVDEQGRPDLGGADHVDLTFSPAAAWGRLEKNPAGGSVSLVNITPPGGFDVTVKVGRGGGERRGSLSNVPVNRARATLSVVPIR